MKKQKKERKPQGSRANDSKCSFLNILPGSVDVMVENLDNNQENEKWYPVTLATNKGTNGEVPSIRLKIKYQVHVGSIILYTLVYYLQ